MQQRSSSAGLTVHFLLFVLAIAGISAGVSVHASAQTPPSASSAESYILGPNDRIRLKVYGEPDITGEYEIDSGGQVSIPLAGHIRAAGLTTRQLERSIASALAKGSCGSARQRRDRTVSSVLHSRRGQEERRISLSSRPDGHGRGRKRRRIHLSRQRKQGLSAPIRRRSEETYASRRAGSGFSGRQHPDSRALLLTSRHRR